MIGGNMRNEEDPAKGCLIGLLMAVFMWSVIVAAGMWML